jgi:hypothetical protein
MAPGCRTLSLRATGGALPGPAASVNATLAWTDALTGLVTSRQGTGAAFPWLRLRGFKDAEVLALARDHYLARGEAGGETRGRVF